MKRNLLLLAALILFNVIFRFVSGSFVSKPDEIYDLEELQQKENEKYITAQILSQSLNQVYAMFESNLAATKNDERNEAASLPFLEQLTDILDRLQIKTLKLKPNQKKK